MKKVTSILFLSMFFLVISAVSSLATIDVNLTVGSTITTGGYFNISYNASDTMNNVSVLLEGRSTSTINSSFSVIANFTNSTQLRRANYTLSDANILVDATDWTFRATVFENGSCSNCGSASVATSASVTGVTLSRSRPAIRDITAFGTQTSNAAYTITFGLTNATRYTFSHTGDADKTVTVTGNLINSSFSHVIVPRSGSSYTIAATDLENTTTVVTSYTLNGDVLTGITLQGTPQQFITSTTKKPSKNKTLILVLTMTVVLTFLLMTFTLLRKKRR